jgi:hypothetical protein
MHGICRFAELIRRRALIACVALAGICSAPAAGQAQGAEEPGKLETAGTAEPNRDLAANRIDIQRLEIRIDEIESEGGAFDQRLTETVLDLGSHLQEAGRHEDAIKEFRRGWHIARVNNGLYAPDQARFLDEIIESQTALSDWPGVADSYDSLLWLYRRNYSQRDTRWLPLLRRLRAWHLQGYRVDTGRTVNEHYYMQLAIYQQAVDIVAEQTGDRRMGLCYWHQSCCRRAQRPMARNCPAELKDYYGLDDYPLTAELLFGPRAPEPGGIRVVPPNP